MEDAQKNLKQKKLQTVTHKINMKEFMENYNQLCIYDVDSQTKDFLEIVEYAPDLFKGIRDKCGVNEDLLFTSFAPIHNIQAIHNFFTGSGKSQSFFFFSDNKTFVLKTLKESEKKLLLDNGVLESYFTHIMK